MTQKSVKSSCIELPNIRQIFKQEEEWKHLLAEEVNSLQQAIVQKEEKISEQKVQLDELKKSFIYNYDLLKSRDSELLHYEKTISQIQKILSKREAENSELRITLDQTKEDLLKSQQDAVDWRNRFEEESRRAVTQEAELRRAANSALAKLAESEAAERRRLAAEVTRAQADLEAERARAATDLEAALAEASRRASDASAEAGRARLTAEMRATAAEDAASRARQEARRVGQELFSANETLARLDTEVAAKTQAAQQAEEKVQELKAALTEMEKSKAACELKLSRLESRCEMEKRAMSKELDVLTDSEKSLKMQVYTLTRNLAAFREETEAENHRLLNAVAAAEKSANEAVEALDAAEVERQLALKNSKALETENRRLRGDLNRALAHGNIFEQKKVPVSQDNSNPRELVAQIISLQLTCAKLQDENRQLRRQNTRNNESFELRRQLDKANQQIECLASENLRLLQLSNKMRARERRGVEIIGAPAAIHTRRPELQNIKTKRFGSGEVSPDTPLPGKMKSRGGDEISLIVSSDDDDDESDESETRVLQQSTSSNVDINNNGTSVSQILDDNVHLIHNIINHQKSGNNNHEMQELQILHKNLIYLATIADQATNNGAAAQRGPPPPPPGFPSGAGGPPEHPMPFQPSPNVYPPGPPQSRGQPVVPNYMTPVGAPMMPQHQHGFPPQQQQQPPPPPTQTGVDDRIFMQQQRTGPLPSYGYMAGPPQPPQQQQPQQQMFTLTSANEFGPPRYENPGQPVEAGGLSEAPPVSAPPLQSVPSSGVGSGVPLAPRSVTTPSPKPVPTCEQHTVGEQHQLSTHPPQSQTPSTSAA